MTGQEDDYVGQASQMAGKLRDIGVTDNDALAASARQEEESLFGGAVTMR